MLSRFNILASRIPSLSSQVHHVTKPWNLLLTIAALIFLYFSYFSHPIPTWVDLTDLSFIGIAQANAKNALFTIELATWAIVAFTQVLTFSYIRNNYETKNDGNSKVLWISITALIFVLTTVYTAYKIISGPEAVAPRIYYLFFAAIMIRQLAANALCVAYILGDVFSGAKQSLLDDSSGVLYGGQSIRGQTSIVVLLSFLSFLAFIVWSPTLIAGGTISPKYIAICLAICVALLSIAFTFYVHTRISGTLDVSMRNLEAAISREALTVPATKADVDRVIGLLDIRDRIRKSVGIPLPAIFLNILQTAGVIAAIWSTLLKGGS